MSGLMLAVGLLLVFAGLLGAVLYGWEVVRERRQVTNALRTIESIGAPVPESARPTDKPFGDRVALPAAGWLAQVARTLSGAGWPRSTAARLARAGNPAGWDAERILATKTLSAIGLATLIAGVLLISASPLPALLWGAVFGVVGFFVPDLLLVRRGEQRAEAIERSLPDAIDLLTVTVESGLTFDAGLAQVSRNTRGPLAAEFTRVLKEIQIGSGRAVALKALADRTDIDDLRIFLNSMIQAERLGIPVADVLRVQSAEMRLKRSQRIEEQAMRLPVKIIFPLLLGIMPALFVVILGPALINIYDTLFR
jgi:tight adherence protein C